MTSKPLTMTTPPDRSSFSLAVELEWMGRDVSHRRLRLPDGTLLTLTDEQFKVLSTSVTAASDDGCWLHARLARRNSTQPSAHGFVMRPRAEFEGKDCWQHLDFPDGPAIWCDEESEVWCLSLPELAGLFVTLARADWGDAAGVADLCALAGDPEGLRTLACLEFPHEMAEAARLTEGDRQWEAVQAASVLDSSLVTEAVRLHAPNRPAGSLTFRFSALLVDRESLGVTERPDATLFPFTIALVATRFDPHNPHDEAALEPHDVQWLTHVVYASVPDLAVFERDGQVYVARNPAFVLDCLANDRLVDFLN